MEVKSWTPELLQVCFESTDWMTDSTNDLEEAADTVSEYIHFSEDLVIPKKKINIFLNNKPWVTLELKELLYQKKRDSKSKECRAN